jgi:DNA-binding NtrC family response regulator
MPPNNSLSAEDRKFFSLLKEAGLANPFGQRRGELDMQLAGKDASTAKSQSIDKIVAKLESRIERLEKKQGDDITAFSDPDRSLIEAAFQFSFFYKFRKNFDELIQKQIEAGEKLLKLPFADEAISYLQKKGFTPDEIKKAFEECYQLRRAYFFIGRHIIGRSAVMKKMRSDIWANIFTHNIDLYRRYLRTRMEDFSTLLLGGTGTGKGAVAAAIGYSGFIPFDVKKKRFVESFTRSFISINLSQFPESLIESELFGHKKGAFTGAVDNHKGMLTQCGPNGSILMDEIGEISLSVQIKLLQALQERVFYPVGSHQKERFHGRVIAATNQPIDDLRQKGKFRDDFYYRLCSDIIVLPSLKERIQEAPAELDDLLKFLVKRMVGQDSPELVEMVHDIIEKNLGPDYPWHGNVRELEQCVRSVLLKQDYKGDGKSSAPGLKSQIFSSLEQGDLSAHRLLSGYCKLLYQQHGTFEEVARRTGLDRRTVNKYIKEWDNEAAIDPSGPEAVPGSPTR